jgi:hypothetical protein
MKGAEVADPRTFTRDAKVRSKGHFPASHDPETVLVGFSQEPTSPSLQVE